MSSLKFSNSFFLLKLKKTHNPLVFLIFVFWFLFFFTCYLMNHNSLNTFKHTVYEKRNCWPAETMQTEFQPEVNLTAELLQTVQ